MNKQQWINKIIGHADVDPSLLLAHPENFRAHPDHQEKGLLTLIDEIGFIRSVTVSHRTGIILDGHLRVALALDRGQNTISVEYVDLDEDQERIALAFTDRIASLATIETNYLDSLLSMIDNENQEIIDMIEEMKKDQGLIFPDSILNPPEMIDPVIDNNCLVEIHCSYDFLELINPILKGWENDGATINIS